MTTRSSMASLVSKRTSVTTSLLASRHSHRRTSTSVAIDSIATAPTRCWKSIPAFVAAPPLITKPIVRPGPPRALVTPQPHGAQEPTPEPHPESQDPPDTVHTVHTV